MALTDTLEKGSYKKMLRWRLILGVLITAVFAALCWLDVRSARPGAYLLPLTVLLGILATHELLNLFRAGGHRPKVWSMAAAALLPMAASCVPLLWESYPADCPVGRLGWLAAGLVAGLVVAVIGEMRGYVANNQPGKITTNLAMLSFATLYLGGLFGFLIQLRLLSVGETPGRIGMLALLSLLLVVKFGDTGAYFVGRAWGRHKLAPALSPGKTWEGAVGGLAASVGGALVALGPLANALGCLETMGWGRWIGESVVYGLLVGVAGMMGDLAESLLKRDAGVKDSSSWMPGFGGVLDMLDSILLAAPVAYACWVLGLVGGGG